MKLAALIEADWCVSKGVRTQITLAGLSGPQARVIYPAPAESLP